MLKADNTIAVASNANLDPARITNLADPINNTDAATKKYVDNKILLKKELIKSSSVNLYFLRPVSDYGTGDTTKTISVSENELQNKIILFQASISIQAPIGMREVSIKCNGASGPSVLHAYSSNGAYPINVTGECTTLFLPAAYNWSSIQSTTDNGAVNKLYYSTINTFNSINI